MLKKIVSKTGLSKKKVKLVMTALFENVMTTLAKDNCLELRGFGTFKVKQRLAKIGTNPVTHEKMLIPAHKSIIFKPSRKLSSTLAQW